MIQVEGTWSSDAFMVYYRAHIEDAGRVSRTVLVDEAGGFSREPGKGLGGGRVLECWETRLFLWRF